MQGARPGSMEGFWSPLELLSFLVWLCDLWVGVGCGWWARSKVGWVQRWRSRFSGCRRLAGCWRRWLRVGGGRSCFWSRERDEKWVSSWLRERESSGKGVWGLSWVEVRGSSSNSCVAWWGWLFRDPVFDRVGRGGIGERGREVVVLFFLFCFVVFSAMFSSS